MRDEHEHPVDQPIKGINVTPYGGVGGTFSYQVGFRGVTHIEACTKSGLHANIPYVRVWAEDRCIGEFCQHNIVGVYFD